MPSFYAGVLNVGAECVGQAGTFFVEAEREYCRNLRVVARFVDLATGRFLDCTGFDDMWSENMID